MSLPKSSKNSRGESSNDDADHITKRLRVKSYPKANYRDDIVSLDQSAYVDLSDINNRLVTDRVPKACVLCRYVSWNCNWPYFISPRLICITKYL